MSILRSFQSPRRPWRVFEEPFFSFRKSTKSNTSFCFSGGRFTQFFEDLFFYGHGCLANDVSPIIRPLALIGIREGRKNEGSARNPPKGMSVRGVFYVAAKAATHKANERRAPERCERQKSRRYACRLALRKQKARPTAEKAPTLTIIF